MAYNIFQSIANKKFVPQISTNYGTKSYGGNTSGNVGTTFQTKQPAKSTPSLGVYGANYYSNLNRSTPTTYSSSLTPGLDKINAKYPSTIKPSAPTPPPPVSIDKTPPPATDNTSTNMSDPNAQYNNYLDASSKAASDRAKAKYDAITANTNESNALAEKGLNEDISSIGDFLKGYTERTNANASRSKENAKTASGEAQRRLAEGRRSAMSDTEKRYAALGTVDSYGTGSFTQANENVNSDFNRQSAQNEASLQDKLFTIDSTAADQVASEEQKFNDAVRQIKKTLAGNTLAQKQAIQSAYLDYQDTVAGIADQRDGLKLQAQQEQLKLKQTKTDNQLSDNFVKTGVPETMNDFIFKAKNPGGFETKIGAGISSGQNEAKDTSNLINEVLSKDLGPNTGLLRVRSVIPGTEAYTTQQKINQIKDKLALAARGELKGQGQISDRETAMLKNAVTALDSGMSEKDFVAELQKVKSILEKNNGLQSSQSSIDQLAGQYGI